MTDSVSDPIEEVVRRAADLAAGLAVSSRASGVKVAIYYPGPQADAAYDVVRHRLFASGPEHWLAVESTFRFGLTLASDIASIGKPGAGRSVLVGLLPLAKQIIHDMATAPSRPTEPLPRIQNDPVVAERIRQLSSGFFTERPKGSTA